MADFLVDQLSWLGYSQIYMLLPVTDVTGCTICLKACWCLDTKLEGMRTLMDNIFKYLTKWQHMLLNLFYCILLNLLFICLISYHILQCKSCKFFSTRVALVIGISVGFKTCLFQWIMIFYWYFTWSNHRSRSWALWWHRCISHWIRSDCRVVE